METMKKQKIDWGKFWRITQGCFLLHWLLTILFVILSALLLLYAFCTEAPNPIIVYFGYAFSAYTLTVVVIKCPGIFKRIKRGLYANHYSARYLSEPELRANISLHAGFAINVLYAVFKLGMGIYFRSLWLGAVAIYYMILSIMRFGLLHRQRITGRYEDKELQYRFALRSYRFTGKLMFILNIAVSGMVVQMIWQNKSYEYPGFMIYAMAAYAFYCMGIAIKNMIKYRKLDKPILSAAKMLSASCAMISILALQTAMLTQFGGGDIDYARLMNGLTGSAVCLGILGMAVWMVRKANRELKKKETENG